MMQRILKGDTSGQIALALADGYNYAGCVVEFRYQGVVRTFHNCEAGQTIQFNFTAAETAVMALGAFPVEVRLCTTDGRFFTVNNADVKIEVTDCVADVREGGMIVVEATSGLYGVDDLPERYTTKDVRNKINEIIARLGGGVAVLCFAACMAFGSAFGAGVTVQKSNLDDIHNDDKIVTDVTLDVSGLATEAYVQEAISAAGSVTPETLTNVAENVVVRDVPAWARAANPPEAMSANALTWTNGAVRTKDGAKTIEASDVGAFAKFEFADNGVAVQYDSTDGGRLAVAGRGGNPIYWRDVALAEDLAEFTTSSEVREIVTAKTDAAWTVTLADGYQNSAGTSFGLWPYWLDGWYWTVAHDGMEVTLVGSGEENAAEITFNDLMNQNFGVATARRTTPRNALGLAEQGEVDEIRRYLTAQTNAYFVVTNYESSAGTPATMQLYEWRDGERRLVWDQRTHTTNELAKAERRRAEADGALEAKIAATSNSIPSAAWGARYPTGGENPATNELWISTPTTVLSGGFEWQKNVTAHGSLWVLRSNGIIADLGKGGVTNGAYLSITDWEGKEVLTVTKTASQLVDALPSEVETTAGGDFVVRFFRTETQPVAYVKLDLTDGGARFTDEMREDSASCPAVVSWRQEADAWVATFTPKETPCPQMFVAATYEKEGETVIQNNAPIGVGGGMMVTNSAAGGFITVYPKWNGSTVIWSTTR